MLKKLFCAKNGAIAAFDVDGMNEGMRGEDE
jgi:hypothetical protein